MLSYLKQEKNRYKFKDKMKALQYSRNAAYARFYLILAILNYFNLSSVFILHFHAFLFSAVFFNFFSLILTDAASTCLECPRGRVAVY